MRIITYRPRFQRPIDQCCHHHLRLFDMEFLALQSSYDRSLCRAGGTFEVHLIHQTLHFFDDLIFSTRKQNNTKWHHRCDSIIIINIYLANECLSKLLDVFRIPLHGFLASGAPWKFDAIISALFLLIKLRTWNLHKNINRTSNLADWQNLEAMLPWTGRNRMALAHTFFRYPWPYCGYNILHIASVGRL